MNKNKMSWEEIHELDSLDGVKLTEEQELYMNIVSLLFQIDKSAIHIFLLGFCESDADKTIDIINKTSSSISKIAEFLEKRISKNDANKALSFLHAEYTMKNLYK